MAEYSSISFSSMSVSVAILLAADLSRVCFWFRRWSILLVSTESARSYSFLGTGSDSVSCCSRFDSGMIKFEMMTFCYAAVRVRLMIRLGASGSEL